jgi:hypothetical protein
MGTVTIIAAFGTNRVTGTRATYRGVSPLSDNASNA